jgi:hypothetical protein
VSGFSHKKLGSGSAVVASLLVGINPITPCGRLWRVRRTRDPKCSPSSPAHRGVRTGGSLPLAGQHDKAEVEQRVGYGADLQMGVLAGLKL